MRVVYAGLLLAGLILVGATVYESTATNQGVTVNAMEDGTPMPPPSR